MLSKVQKINGLKKLFGKNKNSAQDSSIPKSVQRRAKDLFDHEYYLSENSDVKQAGIDPYLHYSTSGWQEGRNPNPLFITNQYLSSEDDFKRKLIENGLTPLTHYVMFGNAESNREVFFNQKMEFYRSYQVSTPVHTFSKPNHYTLKKKAAAFIHCYYIDIASRLIDLCIEKGIDVYAAFIEGTEYQTLIDKYENRISYKVFENRGRDIAPFVTGFNDVLDEYECAIHLHTKKSLHYGEARTDWLDYIVQSLLEDLGSIERLLSDDDVSIVFPEPPDFLKDQMNWGWNYNRISALMNMLGKNLNVEDELDFPAGSMFWFKVKDLLPIFNLNLPPILFDYENGQVDGTLAHAIERLFGLYVLSNGKKLVPIRSRNPVSFVFDSSKNTRTELRELDHVYKSEESYSSALKYFYPELTPLTFRKSESLRPRLNILLPTINVEHVFGGISTALKFFFLMAEKLNYDVRIISTDSVCYAHTAKDYHGFSNYSLAFVRDDDHKQILSAAPRIQGDMAVRKNDLFIATAWWTAHHLKKIQEFQNETWSDTPNHIYFVQDYEPHFYAWSSKSQLADNTYINDWFKVYNTDLLYSYFCDRGKVYGPSFTLKPRLNTSIDNALKQKDQTPKEKVILLYGRPSAERNCNEVLLEAISLLKTKYNVSDEWRVISLGEEYQHDLLSELKIEVKGKVSLEEYADLLSKSYLGISLMVSPHPSYPPIEMACAGLHTYTNYYDNKTQGSIKNTNLHFGGVDSEEIAFFLYSHIENFQETNAYNYRPELDVFGSGDELDTVVAKLSKEII